MGSYMECPVCRHHMMVREIQGVHVDICDTHGVWLDRGELEKLLEASKKEGWIEGFGNSLRGAWSGGTESMGTTSGTF